MRHFRAAVRRLCRSSRSSTRTLPPGSGSGLWGLTDGWKRFFGLREIGIHDGFFELGGHSLLAVQILSKINETFSTELGLQEFFDAPTIAGLAGRISGSSVSADETELAALLSEVEGLSEEELKTALDAQGQMS